MILAFHITVAFTSIILTALAYVSPSKGKLFTTYLLAAATFSSGTLLLIQSPSHFAQACIAGLTYFSIVGFGIALTRSKLAAMTDIQQQ